MLNLHHSRRWATGAGGVCAILLCLFCILPARAAGTLETVVISYPGPRNISYLPLDIIPRIGADRQEGLSLRPLFTGGGAVALNNLVTRNADFAVAGMPAAMSLRVNGGDVVVLAAVNDTPLFVLMVRAGLKGKVKSVADLRGRVIGVNTSTKHSKTTSQQLAELLLSSAGVPLDAVRIVPAGQSWEEQSALMVTGTADAVMGDEPFASRLQAEGKVFFLANLAEPNTVKGVAGTHFLHAALETRGDVIRAQPDKVARVVRMLQRALDWLARHSPEEVVKVLGITDADERDSLLLSLRKYPRIYSRDGKLSSSQLQATERFFRSTSQDNSRAAGVRIETMVDDRWAGRRD